MTINVLKKPMSNELLLESGFSHNPGEPSGLQHKKLLEQLTIYLMHPWSIIFFYLFFGHFLTMHEKIEINVAIEIRYTLKVQKTFRKMGFVKSSEFCPSM